jgi:F-type H+-transporting ATPase subunit a
VVSEQSPITHLLNQVLGSTVAGALHALGFQVSPDEAIPESLVMALVTFVLGVVLVLLLKPRISVERPGALQQVCEALLTNPTKFGIRDLLDENSGHDARKYLPMVGTISIFILIANLLGLVPVLRPPTEYPAVPLACALITFVYFNGQGVRVHGVAGYLGHFAGPTPFLAPLLFPVEIISTSARILSLTVRLYANIFASELIYLIFLKLMVSPVDHFSQTLPAVAVVLGIFPLTIPILFLGLAIFVAVVQAMVFTILPAIYLGMATAHEH